MKTYKEFLTEMPYLHDEELGLQVLSKLSKQALGRSYHFYTKVNDLEIYQKQDDTAFIGGFQRNDGFAVVVSIRTRKNIFPSKPEGLTNPLQISMVNVCSGFEDEGLTKKVYSSILKRYDLVSDHEQYVGAKGLWKSLARDHKVLAYDTHSKTYISDWKDSDVWGSSIKHRQILLVIKKDSK